MRKTPRSLALLGATFLLAVGLTACGDDDDSTAAETPQTSTSTSTSAPAQTSTTEATHDHSEGGSEGGTEAGNGKTVEVHAVEYGFQDLPKTIEAGTRLVLANHGTQPHELIAFRIPDSETRSVEELVKLPEDQLAAVFGPDMEPATVILSKSGQTNTPGPVVGDGTLTEPGRYAIVCLLPVGAEDSLLDAPEPPQSDAPPHASQGMYAELTVK
jgi:hypothetical protein